MREEWAVDTIALNFTTELDFNNYSMGFGEVIFKVAP